MIPSMAPSSTDSSESKTASPQSIIQGFTRQETIALTGMDSNKLSYMDVIGLVVPKKIGSSMRPRVFYSAEQVLQLRIIYSLRTRLSFQDIALTLAFLKKREYRPCLFNRKLVFVQKEIYLIDDWEEFGRSVLIAASKNRGRVKIHDVGTIGSAASEVATNALTNQIPDYKKRIRDTPLEPRMDGIQRRQKTIKGKLLSSQVRPPIVLEAD